MDYLNQICKKAQHPVGLFYVFVALGITPVVPHNPCTDLYCYSLEHPALYVPIDRKSAWGRIAAKGGNCCEQMRTKLFKFYPKGYPQILGIIWAVDELIMHTKVSIWLNINQFCWQEISKLFIKKPTCFQVGFLGFASQFFIA